MNTKGKRAMLAVLLIISIANYSRISGTENIRYIEFLSIFVIGAISSLLLRDVVSSFRKNK
jgi:hypothetical protein